MNRLLLALCLAFLAAFNAIPQNPTDQHERIINAVNARDHAAAIAELEDLEKRDAKAFAADNYDYLFARMAQADGDLAIAMGSYQLVANRDSVLAPYALLHLSQLARSTGNLMLERLSLLQILFLSPDSLLVGAARDRLAHNCFEAANYGETIRILAGGVSNTYPSNGTSGDAGRRGDLALLGQANLRSGEIEKARAIFLALLNTIPNAAQPDDAVLTASLGLDLLDGKQAPNISEAEHLQRANIYQFNREFSSAKLHYESIITNSPMAPNSAEATFQIGRGYSQQGDFAEASKWFERVLKQFPEHQTSKDALLQLASADGRAGKPTDAIKRYKEFIVKYPAADNVDRAYLNIIDTLRDQGEDGEALKWCSKTQQVFAGKLPATLALFAEARIFIARRDWPSALTRLEKLAAVADLGGTSVPGATNATEVTYLKAYALEQMSQFSAAIDLYLSLDDGRGEYYGWRATERLKSLSMTESARPFVSQKLTSLTTGLAVADADTRRKSAQAILRLTNEDGLRENAFNVLTGAVKVLPGYQAIPNFRLLDPKNISQGIKGPHEIIAAAFIALGLYDEAVPELDAAQPNALKGSDDIAHSLATYYERGDRADRAMAFIEPLWRKVPADYPIELLPREQLEMLYPAPYADVLLKSASERGVDPRFVLAIMRQESRFDPDARSNAAARGLMQFTSTTATTTAAELGIKNFSEDELYYPPTAILFGSQYLAGLFKQFPEQNEAVAASYNGGADNMARWLARSGSNSPDRYVPEIMYSQSKDYVYKVMANYRMYQYLYDENLRPR